MAYYSIFPEKDSTIYSHPDRTLMNTGNDEILELVKEKGSQDGNYYPSRILIQFKDSDIQTVINKIGSSFSSSLQLFSTEHKNLSSEQAIEVVAISQSWDEGTGRYSNLPSSSNGCTWIYRDNSVSKKAWPTTSFSTGTTGSIFSTIITQGGGSWYNTSEFKSTQQYSNSDNLDLDLNVTSIVEKSGFPLNSNVSFLYLL